jgi:hypothetical protein
MTSRSSTTGGLAWRIATLAVAAACWPAAACADHAAAFYPSYYPQEIRIDTLAPADAASGWAKAVVHAYVGADPFREGAAPADAIPVQSLRGYVVLTFDGDAGDARYASADARCAAAARVRRALQVDGTDVVAWPYPVTPWHDDYLAHYDVVSASRSAAADDDGRAPPRVRVLGDTAPSLVPASMRVDDGAFDATLEAVDLAPPADGLWPDDPSRRDGWRAAQRLFAGHVHGADAARAAAAARALERGGYGDAAARIGLERTLVRALTASCERVVLGYTLRREVTDDEYSQGVESIGSDAQDGLASAIFVRTVKLKDFPWNGWLRLGIGTPPRAAWNPVGGFDDAFGRLVWSAVADPALLPAPRGGGFIANRVHVDAMPADARPVPVPADAWRPQAGTGRLVHAGAGVTAAQRVRVAAVASTFHDGAQMTLADLVYPYVVAARASASAPDGTPRDPDLARAGAGVAKALVAFRYVETRRKLRDYGDDMKFSYAVPVVDVYLARRTGDAWRAAAAAPPWSTLPWQVVALMEAASARGIAALSAAEAKRRGLPWLDLARDAPTGAKLAALVDAFAQEGYRPVGLEPFVSVAEARARWRALAAFHAKTGHFLDTNGPYRLMSWTATSATLAVFRDESYPEGLGSFDAYGIPRRAWATSLNVAGGRLVVGADVEAVERFQRSVALHRVTAGRGDADEDALLRCRYVIVAANGNVVRAGEARFGRDARATVPLAGLTGGGNYTIMVALDVGGNTVDPEVRTVSYRAAGRAQRGAGG